MMSCDIIFKSFMSHVTLYLKVLCHMTGLAEINKLDELLREIDAERKYVLQSFDTSVTVCMFIHNKPSGFNDTTESTKQVFIRHK